VQLAHVGVFAKAPIVPTLSHFQSDVLAMLFSIVHANEQAWTGLGTKNTSILIYTKIYLPVLE
jgi:hypothetical protein